jgi:hypothetical protein
VKTTLIRALAGVAALLPTVVAPATGFGQTAIDAQAEDIGMREHVSGCAVCRGNFGKGDGPLNPLLKKPSPYLTVIQKRNNGVFPFDRVYRMIDGRDEPKIGKPPASVFVAESPDKNAACQ